LVFDGHQLGFVGGVELADRLGVDERLVFERAVVLADHASLSSFDAAGVARDGVGDRGAGGFCGASSFSERAGLGGGRGEMRGVDEESGAEKRDGDRREASTHDGAP
jgi:hypothetical protein